MENRLATIVFIDMQGYTKRSAQQTIEEMKLFHDEMFNFVKTHLEKYQGIMVKTLGDGFLARFDSPTQAVQCGLEMQRKLEARNAQMLNPDSIVRFRIGINTGEIGIDESGDVFGDPVNIASRIQSYAEPNEVYISESTFLAMNRNEVGAQDLGMQMFKNATREIRIYKILKQGSPGLVLPAAVTPSSAHGPIANKPAGHGAPGKAAPAWQTWLKVGIGIFVVLMFLNGVRHAFKRQPPPNHGPEGIAPPTNPTTAPVVTAKPNPTEPPDGPDDEGETDQGPHLSPLEIDPDNPPAKVILNPKQRKVLKEVKELHSAGKVDDAIKLAKEQEESVKQAPPQKRIDYYLLLGQLYQDAGKKQESMDAFNQARDCLGKNPFKRRFLDFRIQKIQTKGK